MFKKFKWYLRKRHLMKSKFTDFTPEDIASMTMKEYKVFRTRFIHPGNPYDFPTVSQRDGLLDRVTFNVEKTDEEINELRYP